MIPVPCIVGDKLTAEIVYCMEKQYREYKDGYIMPEHFLQTTFLEDYLLKRKGIKVADLMEISSGLSVATEKAMFEWKLPRFLSVEKVRELVEDARLDYGEFIDAYSAHLKSL